MTLLDGVRCERCGELIEVDDAEDVGPAYTDHLREDHGQMTISRRGLRMQLRSD